MSGIPAGEAPTGATQSEDPTTLWGPELRWTSLGMFALVFFVAFETVALITVMPDVARALDGLRYFALSFAAPLASGVVGMVATGLWSDRRGPGQPLLASIVLFVVGLTICGLSGSMEQLVLGRVLQGLGGGGIAVAIYIVVGLVVPAALRPRIFALFAAAWVLPALIGPLIAALVAGALGWRWVFLGVVGLVIAATALIASAIRRLPPHAGGPTGGWSSLGWSIVAGVAVLSLDVGGGPSGGAPGATGLAVIGLAITVVLVAVRRLVPAGALVAVAGLPSVILTRGAIGAGFLAGETYVPFVLQERWGWTTAHAGMVLAAAGVAWALGSQVQARVAHLLSDRGAMVLGATLLLAGTAVVAVVVASRQPPAGLVVGYSVAALGMGLAYPRTTIAALAVSTDADRGFNSAALTISDSLGAALALAISGVMFAALAGGPSAFVAVFVAASGWALLAVVAARRTLPA
ncbi:MAG: MFS transporter [Nocardioides sp.]